MKINNFQLMTELHCRHGENRENEDTCSVVEGIGNSKFQKYISYEITYLNIIFLMSCSLLYHMMISSNITAILDRNIACIPSSCKASRSQEDYHNWR